MRKIILGVGLIAGLLLSSCVEDNESAEVLAQRRALTEKILAEAGKTNAEKALLEVQKQLKEVALAYEKAVNELKIARANAENKAALLAAEARVAAAKHDVEIANLKAEQRLAAEKQRLEEAADALAQKIKDYKGKVKQAALNGVRAKYNSYSSALSKLLDYQSQLAQKKQDVVDAENGLVDVKVAKEKAIKENEARIAHNEKLIASYKSYEQYVNNDASVLKEKINSMGIEADKLYDMYSVNVNKLNAEYGKRNEAYNVLFPLSNTDYFGAMQKLGNKGLIKSGNLYDLARKYEKVGTIYYRTYTNEEFPVVNTDRYNLELDKYDAKLKDANKGVTTATAALTSKTTTYNAKKAAYEADKTDAKKVEYEAALSDKEQAERALKAAKDKVAYVEGDKAELEKAYTAATLQKNIDAVMTLIDAYNSSSKAVAEARSSVAESRKEWDLAIAKRSTLSAVYNGQNSAEGVKTLSDKIATLEKENVNLERENANLVGVDSQKALVEYRKNSLAELEARITLQKQEVEITKKTYEDALAALK